MGQKDLSITRTNAKDQYTWTSTVTSNQYLVLGGRETLASRGFAYQ